MPIFGKKKNEQQEHEDEFSSYGNLPSDVASVAEGDGIGDASNSGFKKLGDYNFYESNPNKNDIGGIQESPTYADSCKNEALNNPSDHFYQAHSKDDSWSNKLDKVDNKDKAVNPEESIFSNKEASELSFFSPSEESSKSSNNLMKDEGEVSQQYYEQQNVFAKQEDNNSINKSAIDKTSFQSKDKDLKKYDANSADALDEFYYGDSLEEDNSKPSFSSSLKEEGSNLSNAFESSVGKNKDKLDSISEPSGTDLVVQKSSIKIQQSTRKPLGEQLIERGVIDSDQRDIALKYQKGEGKGKMLGAILVELGFLTPSALGEILADSTGAEKFDKKTTIIDSALVKQVPKEIASRHRAVPVYMEGQSIYVAMSDIYNVIAIDALQRYFPPRLKMVPIQCLENDLTEIINDYYDYELSVDGILAEIEAIGKDKVVETTDESYTNPTVRLVDSLLMDAVRRGASDLHFEPEENFVRLRYRIDGKLQQIKSFFKDYWSAVLVRIKIISSMSITETRNPQDGRIELNILGRRIDFRVSSQPTVHGENVVLRVLDSQKSLLPLSALGYSEINKKNIEIALKRPEGIIIVTGPTGSGKTTTLYSVLGEINKSDVNIMTLEDPVEYNLPLIRQSNIRSGYGMSFVDGIKSLLRQDPDIIFVGEIRDKDTATMALRAAMTGHQVFTSLHTNDAIGALPRLVDIGLNPSLISGSIIACVAQRLARKLCLSCRQAYTATEEECKILGADKNNPPTIYKAGSCEKCSNTGYKGRVAVSEVVLVDSGLDELIAKNATRNEMLDYLKNNDFVDMAGDGVQKVLSGLTSMEELVRTVNMTEKMR